MSSTAALVVLTIICGIASAMQAQFMGLLDRGLGTMESIFITYFGGGVVILSAVVIYRGGNLMAWQSVPWYALTAGLLGLIIVGTLGFVVPRLGLVTVFTITVSSQFIVAAILDHFGLFGAPVREFDLTKLAGVATILFGVWLIMRQ